MTAMRHFQRRNQGARFIDRFLILALGDRISNKSSSRLHAGQPFPHHHRPNGDAGVEIARKVEIQNGARVDAAASGLELVDDFHGANLGRTRDSPRRETGGEGFKAIHVRPKAAAERGDQMHNVGIVFDELQPLYAD